jgi:hypothetical protein
VTVRTVTAVSHAPLRRHRERPDAVRRDPPRDPGPDARPHGQLRDVGPLDIEIAALFRPIRRLFDLAREISAHV